MAISLQSISRGRAQKAPRIVLVGVEKVGKCLGKGTPVLMFDGTIKPVEDVRVGDLLIGPDSRPRRVLNLSSGTSELYRVTQKHGDSYVVTGNHILSLRMSRRNKKRLFSPLHQHRVITAKDYLNSSKCFKRDALGWKASVDWPEQSAPLPVPAYILGEWLGDGHSKATAITSADHEVVDEFEKYASAGRKMVFAADRGCATTYRVSRVDARYSNLMRDALRQIGVWQNKHIPHCYKVASRQNRLELLAGLMDTDGNLGGKKLHFEITQKSERLARDIAFVARSLGFSVRIRPVEKCCHNSPVGVYWQLTIGGNIGCIPTRVRRKTAPMTVKRRNARMCSIDVTPVGVGEYFGFEVDGDHLFLLGDFTVTHNSRFGASIPGSIFVPMKGERGIDELDAAKFPPIESLPQLAETFDVLKRENHDFTTAVIDSASAFEPLVWDQACKDHKVEGIEQILGGFGKWKNETLKYWRWMTEELDALRDERNMGCLVIGHVKTKEFNDPETEPYTQYQFDITDNAANLLYRWADVILFANFQRTVVEKTDKGFGQKVARGKGTGVPKLYTQKRPAHPGGSRMLLPFELPLDWGAFATALEQSRTNGQPQTN